LAGDYEQSAGINLILLLSPFYVGGVFLFSYGYELYNVPRALRLTAIIVFVTLAAVVIVAVLFALAGDSSGKSSSSSSKSKSSSSSRTKSSSSQSSSSSGHNYGGSAVFLGGGGSSTVRTREVTKEVVKEVPKEPMPITCPFCSRSYMPAENNFICPSCGAATPRDLIEESQMPKSEE
jgi:hypothetical protein